MLGEPAARKKSKDSDSDKINNIRLQRQSILYLEMCFRKYCYMT